MGLPRSDLDRHWLPGCRKDLRAHARLRAADFRGRSVFTGTPRRERGLCCSSSALGAHVHHPTDLKRAFESNSWNRVWFSVATQRAMPITGSRLRPVIVSLALAHTMRRLWLGKVALDPAGQVVASTGRDGASECHIIRQERSALGIRL